MLLRKSFQKGFTLVELLVGLAISLLVGLVALNYLAASTRALTNQNASDLIQENARFAFDFLSSEVRLAGLNDVSNVERLNLVDGVTNASICTADPNIDPQDGQTNACNIDGDIYTLDGQPVNSDRIAIDYVASDTTTCSGESIAGEASIITVYWVADIDQDNIPSLYCQSYVSFFNPIARSYSNYRRSGTAATPLVDGVESLQVLYGVDSGNVDGSSIADIEFYTPYVNNIDNLGDIRSAKIGLLVSSGQFIQREQNTELAGQARTYSLLGQNFNVPANDRIDRKTLTTTVHFQNLSPAEL